MPVNEYIKHFKMDMGSIPISSIFCIRGRVVEGTGLIIRFPLEHHWFKSSRMQVNHFYIVFFKL